MIKVAFVMRLIAVTLIAFSGICTGRSVGSRGRKRSCFFFVPQ